MRKQPYPVTDLTGGLNIAKTPTLLTDRESPNLYLTRWEKGALERDKGALVFSSVPERPMLIDTYYQIDGDSYTICWTVDGAYQYNSTTGVFSLITGSDIYTGDEDNLFSGCIFSDEYVIANGKDDIYRYNGTTYQKLGGLNAPDTDITAKIVIPFYNHLFLLHTIEGGTRQPLRVRWCDTNDYEEWDDATTNAGYYDLDMTIDWITGGVLLGDRLFIFKERSIWEIIYVNTQTTLFDYKLVIDGVGSYAPNSIVSLGDSLLFFGTDNVYIFDGSRLESIGDNIFPWLYETHNIQVNSSKLNRSLGLYVEETGEYLLVIPKKTSDNADLFLKYQMDQKSWTVQEKALSALGYYSAITPTTWASATGTWEDSKWKIPWSRRALPSGAPTTLLAKPSGIIQEDDRLTEADELTWQEETLTWDNYSLTWDEAREGNPAWMRWESKDWIFGHACRVVEFRFLVKGEAFQVSYSLDGGLTWSVEEEVTPGSLTEYQESVVYLNETTQKVRVKVRTQNYKISILWVEPWYVPRKRSEELN